MRPQDYQSLLETSQRINWRVDDLIGGDVADVPAYLREPCG